MQGWRGPRKTLRSSGHQELDKELRTCQTAPHILQLPGLTCPTIKSLLMLGMEVHTCNRSTWVVEAGREGVQGQPGLRYMRSHFKNRESPDLDTGKPLPLPFRLLGFMSGRKALNQDKSSLSTVRMESWLTYDSSVCMGRQAHPATQFHSNVTLLPNLHMGPNSGRQQKPKLAGQTSGQHVLARLHTVSKQRRNSHLTQALPTAQHSLPSPGTEFLNNQQEAPTGQVTADLVPINKSTAAPHSRPFPPSSLKSRSHTASRARAGPQGCCSRNVLSVCQAQQPV